MSNWICKDLSSYILLSGARVSSRIFSLGGKLQRKPSPWSLFFRVQGGTREVQGGTLLTAHSYAKKEGLGMRQLRGLV